MGQVCDNTPDSIGIVPVSSSRDCTREFKLCPKERRSTHSAFWYQHTDIPRFTVCSVCFGEHIAKTALAHEFLGKVKPDDGTERYCFYSVPRVRIQLWPEALATGDFSPVLDFAKRRSEVKDCLALKGAAASHGIKWFKPANNIPEGFVVCEACYVDHIMASPFASEFIPHPDAQPSNVNWACDDAIPSVWRAINNAKPNSSFAETVSEGFYKQGRIACPGLDAFLGEGVAWYRPKKNIEGMIICEACFYENMKASQFEEEFEFYLPAGQIRGICHFSRLPIRVTWDLAGFRKSFAIWWEAASAVLKLPICSANGFASEKWYTLAPESPAAEESLNFDVCPSCYTGTIVPCGLGSHLVTRYDHKDKIMICDLNLKTARGPKYFQKVIESLFLGSYPIFADYVRLVHNVPCCPKMDAVADRRWYGFSDAFFCPECYVTFVKGTELDSRLEYHDKHHPGSGTCDIYSHRMREKWLDACKTGDIETFLAFARLRSQVYAQTVPRAKMLMQMRMMRSQLWMSQAMAAQMAHAGDSISNLAGGSTETWTVTTAGGNVGTGGSEFAASMEARAAETFQRINNMSEDYQIAALCAMWDDYE